jgi:catechol 2,3-dioxygenase-like lactoylglutathione lyase family enzyme
MMTENKTSRGDIMRLTAILSFATAAALGGTLAFSALAQQPNTPTPRPIAPQGPRPDPIIKGAHWHDIHLNVTDVAANVAFYPRHFDATPATWNGQPAVWTQKSWMLFTKVKRPPDKRLITAIWHIGWGSEKPKDDFVKQQGLGTTFFQPITDLAVANGGTLDRFYYMYVQGPDRELIELNTANQHHFDHMHMFSADPIAAGDWYIRVFGVTGRGLSTVDTPKAPRINNNGLQTGPNSNLYFDNVNMIIYPVEYAKKAYAADWVGIDRLQSPRGHINDHFTVSVPDIKQALAECKANGITVTSPVRSQFGGKVKSFFIEGPDAVAIELMEDRSDHPPETS